MAKRSKAKRHSPAPGMPRPARAEAFSWIVALQAAVIVATALLIYWRALSGDWLWDDDVLVTGNRELRSWEGLGQIWFSPSGTDYWPLTWTLLLVEWHLWGDAPWGYHAVSLALHICSAFLLWRLLGRLGLRWGWLGGLLLVIHPLMVESVAWVAEIKNTLSLPLFLLSCDAWLDAEEGKRRAYGKSIAFYLAAMLAKTSTVMLPAVLLLYCWWKRGGVTRREIVRMIPYGVIAVALGLVTFYFQNFGGDKPPIVMGSVMERCLGAGAALCFYLGKFLLPLNLLPIYPQWTLNPPSLLGVLALPALAVLALALACGRKEWERNALFGLGFFFANALPVLGLVKMDYLRVSEVADHLAYLPIIGLIGLAVGAAELLRKQIPSSLRPYGAGALTALFAAMVWQSSTYSGYFTSQETLWAYTLRANPEAWLAHYNLGMLELRKGRVAEGRAHLEAALAIRPDYPAARNNLATLLLEGGQPEQAAELLEVNLRRHPNDSRGHNNLGNALVQLRRFPEAVEQYQEGLRLVPNDPDLHNNLAAAYCQMGLMSEAANEFERVYQLDPYYPNIEQKLAATHQATSGQR
jgi:tetratricopeptide (TPR) repeat protein